MQHAKMQLFPHPRLEFDDPSGTGPPLCLTKTNGDQWITWVLSLAGRPAALEKAKLFNRYTKIYHSLTTPCHRNTLHRCCALSPSPPRPPPSPFPPKLPRPFCQVLRAYNTYTNFQPSALLLVWKNKCLLARTARFESCTPTNLVERRSHDSWYKRTMYFF